MDEQYARRPDGPWTEGHRERSSSPDHYSSPDHHSPTEQFPPARQNHSAQPHRLPEPHPLAEPLAHEGGFPYGMPPAAPYGQAAPYGPTTPFGYADQFIPQHLHVAPHQFPQGPYPQQFGYPPMQQTVYVHGGQTKRVNHALHLILTLLTAGLWLPVWIILAIANS